ncbi:hypothetical protein [Eubacterium sp. 1001713B170207_170306_E7]|uniref:hypothetical protein n=1 Tax=Eubacterium sp. 1001713B170207_170306_E7 TaxID=2787097 RepID=UPI00189B3A7F|nr:hypothetical protein [Eubacterium sp. 1001713B170207_170306_E7]
MKWKIYNWMPWIRLVVLTVCIGFSLFLMVNDLIENRVPQNQLWLFCIIIPAGLEQISQIMDSRAGVMVYKDEREQYLKLEAGALAFKYAKIACVILLCLSAVLNYFLPSLLFTGIVLGLSVFLILMYGMELIAYFYFETMK